MNPIEVIYGQIVAKANNYLAVPDKANGGRRIIKSDKVRDYERSFASQCKLYAGMMIDKPFELLVSVYYRTPSYDLDNSLKTLLDCLQSVKAITDDKLCREIHASKHVDKFNPRVEFAILSAPPDPTLFG